VSRPPLRVAVLGAGTVGRAVIAGLTEYPERITRAAREAAAPQLVGIAVRDLERQREPGLRADLLTDAPAHLVASPDTDVIVEVMGGDEPARTLIAAALGAGKAVVTANKHVVAHHGLELEAIARRSGAAFRFEAAVGGGIPVLGPLAGDLAANHITRVRGIVNGTTNHILTAMTSDHAPYEAVLADAQERGYAEADPSGDVEGDDAVNKVVILARLAFGVWLDPATVGRRPPTARGAGRPGITGVTADAIAGADALGLTIKLLAIASRRDEGSVAAAVLPTAVPCATAFGRTGGVTNAVEIEAEPLGTVVLSGPGAGGAATSSAVLNDIAAIARGAGSTWAGLMPATGPAVSAADPLEDAREWLVVGAGRAPTQTESMTLASARAGLGDAMGDVTLYPIDA
jgi:homoserine dehydrogenase